MLPLTLACEEGGRRLSLGKAYLHTLKNKGPCLAWGRHLVSPSMDLSLGPSSPPLVFPPSTQSSPAAWKHRLSAFRVLCPLPKKFSHLASSRLALEAVCYVLRKTWRRSPLLQSETSAPALYSESTHRSYPVSDFPLDSGLLMGA